MSIDISGGIKITTTAKFNVYSMAQQEAPVNYTTFVTYSLIGSSSVTIAWPSLTSLSSTRVVLMNNSDLSLTAYDFGGSSFSQVGNSLIITGSGRGGVCTIGSSRIAYIDGSNQKLRAYDFDGTNFTLFGNEYNITGSLTNPDICALSSTRVAMVNDATLVGGTSSSIQAYDFDGSSWSPVGSEYVIDSRGSFMTKVTAMSSTRVAVHEGFGGDVVVLDFNGSSFSQVSRTSITNACVNALASFNFETIAITDDCSDILRLFQYTGSPWTQLNASASIASFAQPGLCKMSSTRVCFAGQTLNQIRMYELQ